MKPKTKILLLIIILIVSATIIGLTAFRHTSVGQVYWGSIKSNKFHYPSCKWIKKIKPENLVEFKTREDAIKAGYKPCKECRP
jgi:hypothetical protein